MFSPKISDNANVNLTKLGERYISMTETPIPVEFDAETLETVGVAYEAPGLLTTAHPHLDRASGGMLNYAAKIGPRNKYRFFLVPPGGSKPQVLAELPVKEPAYMHSFGLTERWLVLAEFPFVVNPISIPLSGRPYIENYRWKPELGTRFTLVDRSSGEATGPFETDPFFCFHHANAYEENGSVVVDLCSFEDAEIVKDLYLERLRNGKPQTRPELRRFRIEPESGKVANEQLAEGVELPRINYGAAQRAPLPLRLGRRRQVRLARPDRQGRRRRRRDASNGPRTAAAPASPSSSPPPRRAPRTRACCSRSSSTPAADDRSCWCWTPRT